MTAMLEEALQTKLLHRTARSVALTTQGDVAHQWARSAFSTTSIGVARPCRASGPHRAGCCASAATRASANNGEMVRHWAIDGHGIILRSLWDVAADLDSGRLVRVLPGYAQEADAWAVYPSRLSTSARVRVCGEFLEEWFDRAGMSEA